MRPIYLFEILKTLRCWDLNFSSLEPVTVSCMIPSL
jgi:hypothetical protein